MALCRLCCMNHNIVLNSFKQYNLLNNFKNKHYELTTLPNLFHTSSIWFKRRKTAEERKSSHIIEYSPKSKAEIVEVWKGITLSQIAHILQRDLKYVQQLFRYELKGTNTPVTDLGLLSEAVKRSGKRIKVIGKPQDQNDNEDKDIYPRPLCQEPTKLLPRPPVVTVMGHVDHGKTTLLDALRGTRVVEQEFGGITQHVGAFTVTLKHGNQNNDQDVSVTFLDTPGHAAFSAMRQRGANITDIVVLVVAADDGVMEQTIESIRMANLAKVPIMVAVNKIDAPGVDPSAVENQLIPHGVQCESMGGDVQCVHVSALKRINLDRLIEALSLQAEVLQLSAEREGPVEGVIVESRVDQGRGRLAIIVIKRGTLRKGTILLAGTSLCKIRTMRATTDSTILSEITPGCPAEIDGWRPETGLPSAGDIVLEAPNEKRARAALKARQDKEVAEKAKEDSREIAAKMEQHQRVYKDKLIERRRMGRFRLRPEGPRQKEIQVDPNAPPRMPIIIKGDVDGTLEAILDTLDTYLNDSRQMQRCNLDLLYYGVGPVTVNDLEIATAFKGIIYLFNVDCPQTLQDSAEENGISVRRYNVIYKLIDDVRDEIEKRLMPIEIEDIIGEATVLQQFDINDGRKQVPIAGCRCVKGVMKKSGLYRIMRNENILYEGHISTMRHLKSEVDIVKNDMECGLQFSDKMLTFQQGDTIICYEKRMEQQKCDWDPGF